MSKYSSFVGHPAAKIPTHEGGEGYVRTPRQELFIQAVSEMAEDSYYESAEDRRIRLAQNVERVISEKGGWDWICNLASYLRKDGMRSVSIMVAAEAVAARSRMKMETPEGVSPRQLIASVCARGDEPAEMLGYWLQYHGRQIPAPVKRGIADAAQRLYSEFSALKYDGQSRAIRMGDVVDLVHPRPQSEQQSDLFRFVLDHRHGRVDVAVEQLPSIAARRELEALAPEQRHEFMRKVQSGDQESASKFKLAMSSQWEWAKSWLGAK